MILTAISLLDCAVFVLCLIPNVLVQIGLFHTLALVNVLPFLLCRLPYQIIRERYLTKKQNQSAFVQNATFFQDLVIRCVRYAFAYMPASIGRVFFSKWVAYPFLRFRLLRHGYLECPIHFEEVDRHGVKGLWITLNKDQRPDFVVYYCHGGGFSMGSSYFYLEFLMAWITVLKEKGIRNPAIFALEYTLVPDETWPVQFEETRAGYKFLCNVMGDASSICVSGDSAGGTLILSLLLALAQQSQEVPKPRMAVLVSPWTHLVSDLNQNTPSDYLDRDSLHLYARQYLGELDKNVNRTSKYNKSTRIRDRQPYSVNDTNISPGLNLRWREASPRTGFCIVHGSEEVLAKGIEETVTNMKKDGTIVATIREKGGTIETLHAWPVVCLFLGVTITQRLKGLQLMTDYIIANVTSKH